MVAIAARLGVTDETVRADLARAAVRVGGGGGGGGGGGRVV